MNNTPPVKLLVFLARQALTIARDEVCEKCRLGCLTAWFVLSPHLNIRAQESLPVGSHPPAINAPHFPDRAHALVWRNWTLVKPQRLATVLGTSVENVQQMALSMGLPEGRQVCVRMLDRGTMTLLRRNWHLLPYGQLLELLDLSARELVAIVQGEIKLARQLYDLALPDARIGFEASCHYFYVPLDLVEKVVNCDFLLQNLDAKD